MQDLFTKVSIYNILQFLQKCDFYTKIFVPKICLIFLCPLEGRSMVPRVNDNNPFGTQETVSLDFEEE